MNEETTQATETTDAFADGWDGNSADTVESETTDTMEPTSTTQIEKPAAAEAETVEGVAAATENIESQEPNVLPTAETETGDTTAAEKPEETQKTFVLRHLNEEKTVDEAEVVTLAQKGMDYDRVREKYDAAKPVMELFTTFAKEAGMPVAQYVAHVRAQAKQMSGMSEAEALRSVELEDRELVIASKEAEEAAAVQREASQQDTAEQRRKADIAEFQQTFPEAAKTPEKIPPEVWDAVKGGQRLVTAYALFQVKAAQAEANSAKAAALAVSQNQKNENRSAGSMQSAGNESKTRDPFLDGWNN